VSKTHQRAPLSAWRASIRVAILNLLQLVIRFSLVRPGERSRLNSPISAKQRVLAVKAHVELIHEIEHLKEHLAAAQHRNGSLFDLKQDKPEDIATTIVASVSETKACNIAKAITDGIAAACS
jgi:hypothetical protein